MIPKHQSDGLLPPGVHWATWEDLESRFGWTPWRRQLLAGLRRAAIDLKTAGCKALYVDGSFITTKETPGDYDGCWEPTGVDLSRLNPVLMTFDNQRAAQKAKYLGELFPSDSTADRASRSTFLEFFQRSRDGIAKGIIALDLEGMR